MTPGASVDEAVHQCASALLIMLKGCTALGCLRGLARSKHQQAGCSKSRIVHLCICVASFIVVMAGAEELKIFLEAVDEDREEGSVG